MNLKYLLILFASFFTILQSITLQEAIEKNDVKSVKTILLFSNLTTNQKYALLDLAQEIIRKRRDEIALADIAQPPFSAKNYRIGGIVIGIIGVLCFCAEITNLEHINKEFIFLSLAIIFFGGAIAKFAHEFLKNIDRQYHNALEIKQLIYNS